MNTVFVRVFGALVTLLIVILNSNQTGAEGLGEISLIVLAISIFTIVNGFTSGSLVYFIPRENSFRLLFISYTGVLFTILFFVALTTLVDLAPPKYTVHILILSVILSLSGIHEKILIGKENIITSNIISLVKFSVQIVVLCMLYFVMHKNSVNSYVYSLYFSYISELLLLFLFTIKYIKYTGLGGIFPLLKKVLQLSTYNTLASIAQKLNYRLSYYLIEYWFGLKMLGWFSAGMQISESTLIVGRSISMVQYSRISNLGHKESSAKITVLFVKLMLMISSFFMLVLCLIPNTVYSFLFGDDFIYTQNVIISLSLGIVALSCTTVISPFFSGTGNHKINAWAAFAGLIVTLIAGLILIPSFGLIGAGLATTASYLVSLFFQIYLFRKLSTVKLSDFYIKKQDLAYGIVILKQFFFKARSAQPEPEQNRGT